MVWCFGLVQFCNEHLKQFIMKTLLQLFILMLVSNFATAQAVQWLTNSQGPSNYENHTVATDSQGNVYSIGTYNGSSTDFDPTVGVFNMSSYATNMFILKLDAIGNFVWAKQLGGTTVYSISYGDAITVDASDNIYFSGRVSPIITTTFDFDMGSGVYNLSPAGGSNNFIEKLDSSGNFVWVKTFDRIPNPNGFGPYEETRNIKVDALGNVYATGSFTGTTDFDPNSGVFNLTATHTDIFILKLNSLGGLVWAKALTNTIPGQCVYCGGINVGYGIDIDSSGNVYTIGYFSDTIDADPGTGVQNLVTVSGESNSIYVSKLDSNGNYVWAYKIAGGHSLNVLPAIAVDASNNILISSYSQYPATTDLDFGSGTYYLPATSGSFILKINTAGGFIWAKSTAERTASNANSYSNSVITDASGNVYSAGSIYLGTYDLDPGAGTFLVTPNIQEIYVSKLDSNGNFVWAQRVGGNGSSIYNGTLTLSANGKIILSGKVQSGSFTKSIAAVGVGGFLGSITQPVLANNEFENKITGLALYPNPTSNSLNLNLVNSIENGTLKIISLTGQTVLEKQNLSGTDFNFELTSLNAGLYFIQVSDSQNNYSSKFIKQ